MGFFVFSNCLKHCEGDHIPSFVGIVPYRSICGAISGAEKIVELHGMVANRTDRSANPGRRTRSYSLVYNEAAPVITFSGATSEVVRTVGSHRME